MYTMMSVIECSSTHWSISVIFIKVLMPLLLYILCCFKQLQVSANNYSIISTTSIYLQFINSTLQYPMNIGNNETKLNWQYSSLEETNLTTIQNIIPICCPSGYYYKSSKCQINSTIIINNLELPIIYDKHLKLSKFNSNTFQHRYGIPCNYGSYALNSKSPDFDVYYLLENGTIYENNSLHGVADEWLNINDYCLANIINDNNNDIQSVVAVCLPPDDYDADNNKSKYIPIIYPISMTISALFLSITFFIYAYLPELKNIHGITLMAYVASLFFAYLALVLVQFGNETITNIKNLCITLANTIVVGILFNDTIYCPKEALTISDNINNAETNLALTSLIQNNISINNNEKNKVVCPCVNKTCIPICCPHGEKVFRTKCTQIIPNEYNNWNEIYFPQIYDKKNFQTLNELYFNFNNLTNNSNYYYDYIRIFVHDPCIGGIKTRLNPKRKLNDEFKLLNNGTIIKVNGDLINLNNYCLSIIDGNSYSVVLCLNTIIKVNDIINNVNFTHVIINPSMPVGMIISIPFLLLTFIVYSIIPDLKNIHGLTLRGYISTLCIGYTLLAMMQITSSDNFTDDICITIAFLIHFSFLSSFFWLNVMCFDIWWTFGGFRGLQGTAKQTERKKFIIYSIYAWGCASFFTGICLIMDFLPQIPTHFIRPQFGVKSCWFMTDEAKAIYFYAPMGVTIICNITLFISTALKIIRHKKDTAHHLKGIDSRRHDDNKQWFNLYLKLFIVMGINWSMEIISWLCKDAPDFIWYITDLANTLQGVIIFIIFVWKDKIKRLLLKRLGINSPTIIQSRNSTKSGGYNSSNSTSKILVPLREQNSLSLNIEQNRAATITDDDECV